MARREERRRTILKVFRGHPDIRQASSACSSSISLPGRAAPQIEDQMQSRGEDVGITKNFGERSCRKACWFRCRIVS